MRRPWSSPGEDGGGGGGLLIAVNGEKIREPEPELGEAPLVPEREGERKGQ